MKWTTDNNWTAIANLEIDSESVSAALIEKTPINIELRMGETDIPLKSFLCKVGFNCATLKLNTIGTKISIGHRYGDKTKANIDYKKTEKLTNTSKKSAGVSSKVSGIFSPGISANVGNAKQYESQVIEEKSQVITECFVRPSPDGTWQISPQVPKKSITDLCISHTEVLCSIEPLPAANRHGLEIILYVHKRDLVLTYEKETIQMFSNKNKEKIFDILMKKSISEKNDFFDENNHAILSKITNISEKNEK